MGTVNAIPYVSNKSYLHDLLEEYLAILQREYDYRTSPDAMIETINANEYEFTKDGRLV